ncbi:flavodoxin domain-containing protein [uncultured Tateyamaria sp.]|uniref:flavodoxin domain-containing protein n=1 Tax=uncultured Tateyamaria sp. TaxID=455651 RepID=UPI00261F7847|nr:flavodoxin domain-containing protein [uncultured Tateyamaria sp.]
MTTLIAFGTVEGQTRKVAEFVEKHVRAAGEEIILFDTSEPIEKPTFDGIGRVILAAPVHERRHPKPFEAFVAASREELASKSTLFLSISLKAAFPEGQQEAQDFADEMKLRTGLTPKMELLVAGAIHSDSYDYYASQVLRQVVLAGHEFDPSVRDHEFTDWEEVGSCIADFLADHATGRKDDG